MALKGSHVKNYLSSLVYSYLQMNLDVHCLNIEHKCKFHIPNSLTPTKYQQDRHCMYNVILRRVRLTIVAVEKQSVLHILSEASLCMQGN
jgi:hypothetical protein